MTDPALPLAPLLTMTEEELNPPPFKHNPATEHLPRDPVMRAAWWANKCFAVEAELTAQRQRLATVEAERDAAYRQGIEDAKRLAALCAPTEKALLNLVEELIALRDTGGRT